VHTPEDVTLPFLDKPQTPAANTLNPTNPAHLVSKLAGASASEGTSTACTTAGATAGEMSGAAPSGAAAPWSAAAGQHGDSVGERNSGEDRNFRNFQNLGMRTSTAASAARRHELYGVSITCSVDAMADGAPLC
jgi:hypothetical protein